MYRPTRFTRFPISDGIVPEREYIPPKPLREIRERISGMVKQDLIFIEI